MKKIRIGKRYRIAVRGVVLIVLLFCLVVGLGVYLADKAAGAEDAAETPAELVKTVTAEAELIQDIAAEPEPAQDIEQPAAKASGQALSEPQPVEKAAANITEPASQENPAESSLGTYKVTHYCPCSKCCGQYANGYTATGTKATEGRTVAVDPSVIPYGSQLKVVYDDGTEAYYTAEDCGGAVNGNKLDVFMNSHSAALSAGVKTAEVFLVGGGA